MSLPTIEEFDDYVALLAKHDWTYDYSDDSSVWRRGQQEQERLECLQGANYYFKRAFSIYSHCAIAGSIAKCEEELNTLRDRLKQSHVMTLIK